MNQLYEFLHKKMPPERADRLSIIISLVAIMNSIMSVVLQSR